MILQSKKQPWFSVANIRKSFSYFSLLTFGLILFLPQSAWSIRPIFSTLSLVAGEGPAGFQDGNFSSALFNTPLGMAISSDGTRIFIADSVNNRIRVIHLDQDNEVTTLTGQSIPGNQNGSLDSAQFKEPKAVAYLPGDQLIVNDSGNKLLRLIDLKKKTVSTLAGDSPSDLAEGPASKISMSGIQCIVYLSAANSIFFTQPDKAALKRLDLKTGLVTLVPTQKNGLSNLGPLCVSGNKIYVSDQILPKVFSAEWKSGILSELTPVADTAGVVLALTAKGDNLYALAANDNAPLQRLLPQNSPVSFVSVWGDQVPAPAQKLPSFTNLGYAYPVGFASDPNEEGKIYFVNPRLNQVISFRDTYGNRDISSNGILDEFPLHKAPKTFRVMLVGDSRSRMVVTYPFKTTFNVYERPSYPPQINLSKRLEFDLNTLAALDGEPINFEVMNLQTSASEPLFLWPTYRVPDAVRENDIDLVIIMYPPTPRPQFPYTVYFNHPITKEGIPLYPNDMEYLLKPAVERIPQGEPSHFYDLCKAKNLVTVTGNNFVFDEKVFLDPDLHDSLVHLYGKPLEVLNQKISTMKTSSGQPVRLLICSMHSWFFKPNLEDPKIWVDVTRNLHIPFLDMNDEMTAVTTSYYPLTEAGGNDHFNVDGHFFFSQLLAHDLIRDKIIPWK